MWKWFVRLNSNSHTFLTKINVDIESSTIAVNIREVNRKYLVMATGEKCIIHFAWKHLAMEERHCKGMSSCHNCTIAHLKKWPTRCQQGVNKVSTRCQICNHLPRKKCKSSYLSFVCRQKIIFVFVFAFVICFWREGRGPKKNLIFWKNGGGEKKQNVGLIRDQSLRPNETLIRVNYNQNWLIIKRYSSWQGHKGCPVPKQLSSSSYKAVLTGTCVGVVYS